MTDASNGPILQHLVALNRANEIRFARAVIRRAVSSGDASVAEVILSDPPEIARMTIADLLTAQPRWGAHRTGRFLWSVGMSEMKTVGSLTERQRNLLAGML